MLCRVGYQPVNVGGSDEDLYTGPGAGRHPGDGDDLYPGTGTGPARFPVGGGDLYPGPGAGMPSRYFTDQMIVCLVFKIYSALNCSILNTYLLCLSGVVLTMEACL